MEISFSPNTSEVYPMTELNSELEQFRDMVKRFLDKEISPVQNIPAGQRPINQNWSWDRILRSCYIKQADVLQGIYFFEEDFSKEELERNFNFYEPITVHESSLSPCVHSILAAKLGKEEKSYEFFLK